MQVRHFKVAMYTAFLILLLAVAMYAREVTAEETIDPVEIPQPVSDPMMQVPLSTLQAVYAHLKREPFEDVSPIVTLLQQSRVVEACPAPEKTND